MHLSVYSLIKVQQYVYIFIYIIALDLFSIDNFRCRIRITDIVPADAYPTSNHAIVSGIFTWPFIEYDRFPQLRRCGKPRGDALSFGHLVPSNFGLTGALLVETNPFLSMSFLILVEIERERGHYTLHNSQHNICCNFPYKNKTTYPIPSNSHPSATANKSIHFPKCGGRRGVTTFAANIFIALISFK